MRISILFYAESPLRLPLAYNQLIQGFIYTNLEETLSRLLHESGFSAGGRRFKLFTFSRIIGNVKVGIDYIDVRPPFRIIISSPVKDILHSLADNLLKKGSARLGSEEVFVQSISVEFPEIEGNELIVKMLSPVTVYSTVNTHDGKRKTYYYNPKESEFSSLIRENILKKYRAFYVKQPENKEFSIEPIRVSKNDEKIVSYKGFIIKGWMGVYRISGDHELIKLAYDAGIGSKNSQGFGCFEFV